MLDHVSTNWGVQQKYLAVSIQIDAQQGYNKIQWVDTSKARDYEISPDNITASTIYKKQSKTTERKKYVDSGVMKHK